MLEHVASSLAARLMAKLPGWLLRRMMRPEKLASKLALDLRSNAPGKLSDSGAVPQLELWLRVTNHSALPVVLDRVDLEAWFSQPIARAAVIERREIAPHSDLEGLKVVIFLAGTQLASLRREMRLPTWKAEITLQATAYFISKLGWTTVDATIRREGFPVSLGA